MKVDETEYLRNQITTLRNELSNKDDMIARLQTELEQRKRKETELLSQLHQNQQQLQQQQMKQSTIQFQEPINENDVDDTDDDQYPDDNNPESTAPEQPPPESNKEERIRQLQTQLIITHRKLSNAKHLQTAHEEYTAQAQRQIRQSQSSLRDCQKTLQLTQDRYRHQERSLKKNQLTLTCQANERTMERLEHTIRELKCDPLWHTPVQIDKRRKMQRLQTQLVRLGRNHESQTALLRHLEDIMEQHRALQTASIRGDVDAVQMLLSNGVADVNVPDETGFSAFLYACGNDHAHIVRSMLHHADINGILLNDQIKPLILVAKRNCIDILKLLLQEQPTIKLECRDENGMTALHIGCETDWYDGVSLLLQQKVDVNAMDHGGNTALHVCAMAKRDRSEIVRLLLEYSADLERRNADGLDPYTIAVAKGCCKETIQVLEEFRQDKKNKKNE